MSGTPQVKRSVCGFPGIDSYFVNAAGRARQAEAVTPRGRKRKGAASARSPRVTSYRIQTVEDDDDDETEEIIVSDSERETTPASSSTETPSMRQQHRLTLPMPPDSPVSPSPSKPRPPPQQQPNPPKMGRALNETDGMAFDFSADPKLLSVQKTLMAIVDPEGKSKNPAAVRTYVAATTARCVDEINSNKTRQPWKPGNSRMGIASIGDFKTANGRPVTKQISRVFPENNSEESQSDGGPLVAGPSSTGPFNGLSGAGRPRFFGNRPVGTFRPPSKANSVGSGSFSHSKTGGYGGFPPGSISELWAAGGKTGLAAEPSLKNFDMHIINLIESEIMSLDGSTTWADVAGLEGPKKILKEIVVWPFLRPDIFKGIRAPPKGVLLFGPPGTGKTMIGRCVASQCRATFFNISASSLTSKWVGEGEKLVRALFAVARVKLPSVIFIDEVDSLLSSRSESEHESSRRIKTEFLVQLDGVATSRDERLLVLGATNRPYELDEAARRRFQKRIYVTLPEDDARVCIVRRLLQDIDHCIVEEDYQQISEITKGYSGADMTHLCSEAALAPIREADNIETVLASSIRPICVEDFRKASRVVRATVVTNELKAYEEWDKKFGCLV